MFVSNLCSSLLLVVASTAMTSLYTDTIGRLQPQDPPTRGVGAMDRFLNSAKISSPTSRMAPKRSDGYSPTDARGCQEETVTLMRISSSGQEYGIPPEGFTFRVDSTLTLLRVYVNSTRPTTTVLSGPRGDPFSRPPVSSISKEMSEHVGQLYTPGADKHAGPFNTPDSLMHMRVPPPARPELRPHPKEDVELSGFEFGYRTGKWTIQQPEEGEWSVRPPPWFQSIDVTGVSCLAFSYTFLQPVRHSPLDDTPSANTSSLVQLILTGASQIQDLQRLLLRNLANDVIASLDIDGSMYRQRVLVYFTMPMVPFTFELLGYDWKRNPFQRQSMRLISPTMFSLRILGLPKDYTVRGPHPSLRLLIHNMAHTAGFKVTATVDNTNYFQISLESSPSVVVVANSTKTVTIAITVNSELRRVLRSKMKITVSNMADHSIQSLTTPIFGTSDTFTSDHEPPVCRLYQSSGGCSLLVPCASQQWEMTVRVVDLKTGVNSVLFVNPQLAYNEVHFAFNRRNRTAAATYRSTCCNNHFTLRVKDFVGNTKICVFTAPSSDRTTSQPAKNGTNVPSPRHTTVKSSSHRKSTPLGSTRLPTGNPTGISTGIPTDSRPVTGFPASSPLVYARTNSTTYFAVNKTLQQRDSWSDKKYSSFRIAAAVIGSIGLLAVIALVSLCFVYRCLRKRWKRQVRRAQRQGSNGSDVTMGSSWESGSWPSSSCPGSLRSRDAMPLEMISGSRFDCIDVPPTRSGVAERTGRGSGVDSGFFGSGDSLQLPGDKHCYLDASTGGVVFSNGRALKKSDWNRSPEDREMSTPGLSVAMAGRSYSSMVDVQTRLEEIAGMVGNSKLGNDRQQRTRSESSFQTIEEERQDDDAQQFLDEARSSSRLSNDAYATPIVVECFQVRGHESTTLAESSRSSSNEDVTEVGPRSYSLVLKERRPWSPDTFVYRKATLLPDTALVRTEDGLRLVRSFPSRLRREDNPLRSPQSPSAGPIRSYQTRGDCRRARFVSRSSGELERWDDDVCDEAPDDSLD